MCVCVYAGDLDIMNGIMTGLSIHPIYLYVCFSLHLSICVSFCMYVCTYVCMYRCMTIYICIVCMSGLTIHT